MIAEELLDYIDRIDGVAKNACFERRKKLTFHFTGFGKFLDIITNPSMILMQQLPKILAEDVRIQSKCVDFKVLHVSGENSKKELNQIFQKYKKDKDGIHVYIHFGVAASRSSISLECEAWNEATFRGPDECGWQPDEECVNKEKEFGSNLTCKLDIPKILERLGDRYEVNASSDPGRFVCNWVYYNSMTKTSREDNSFSLFVHIPTFETICQKVQEVFVTDLITIIERNILQQM